MIKSCGLLCQPNNVLAVNFLPVPTELIVSSFVASRDQGILFQLPSRCLSLLQAVISVMFGAGLSTKWCQISCLCLASSSATHFYGAKRLSLLPSLFQPKESCKRKLHFITRFWGAKSSILALLLMFFHDHITSSTDCFQILRPRDAASILIVSTKVLFFSIGDRFLSLWVWEVGVCAR